MLRKMENFYNRNELQQSSLSLSDFTGEVEVRMVSLLSNELGESRVERGSRLIFSLNRDQLD